MNTSNTRRENDGFEISMKIQPFIYKGYGFVVFDDPLQEFVIDQVSWKFDYFDVGIPGARLTKLKCVKVTLGNFLIDAEKASEMKGPQKIIGTVPIIIENTNIVNNHQLQVTLFLHGKNPPQLRKPNAPPLSNLAPKSPNACNCPTAILMTSGCQNPSHV